MAQRPVYVAIDRTPYAVPVMVEFEWNGGFAKVQKQKNIRALHESFVRRMPGKKVLEISSKSMQEGGMALSAFALHKYVPELEKSIPVECVYQSGKVFQNGGPYRDLMSVTPREAKRDERLKNSGKLVSFEFDGKPFPIIPKSIFYDYLYMNALLENEELAEIVLQYDGFTDIEFNPSNAVSSQAQSAAAFVSLVRQGHKDKIKDFEQFLSLYQTKTLSSVKTVTGKAAVKHKEEKRIPIVKAGDMLIHKVWGSGTIESAGQTTLTVDFPGTGMKTLGLQWCLENCEIKIR